MYDKAREHLENYEVRPSLQRIAVMEYLMTHRTHPTVDEIFSALSPRIPTLSRTTVYNTVETLAGHGAILALDLGAGKMHYDGDILPHAHFVCTGCGAIHDIVQEPEVAALRMAIPPPGVVFTGMQLTYKGLCAECNRKQKRETEKKKKQRENNLNIN